MTKGVTIILSDVGLFVEDEGDGELLRELEALVGEADDCPPGFAPHEEGYGGISGR